MGKRSFEESAYYKLMPVGRWNWGRGGSDARDGGRDSVMGTKRGSQYIKCSE